MRLLFFEIPAEVNGVALLSLWQTGSLGKCLSADTHTHSLGALYFPRLPSIINTLERVINGEFIF